MLQNLKFPQGFLWGSGTSAFQVEGSTPPCNWTEGARKKFVPEIGRAVDHYHRYEEDFDIAKSLGHNAHRFSIEWSRIEPEEGKFDEKEVEHYHQVFTALRACGLEPFVTLWHFTIPLWLEQKGGAEHAGFPEYFERYCTYVFEKLGSEANYWTTINEPLVFSNNGWLRGSWPPFRKWWLVDLFGGFGYPARGEKKRPRGSFLSYLAVRRNLVKANNRVYTALKQMRPDAQVGLVKQTIYFHSNQNPLNRFKAFFMNWFWTFSFMNNVAGYCDFIGVNQYFDREFGRKIRYEMTDMNWEIYPPGLYGALSLFTRYMKPLYVTENGIADATDTKRAKFIKDNIREVHRAISDGVDVRGFFYWSLLDNYELADGYSKRFGLVEIDYETLERKIRPSAQVYKEICETNTLKYEDTGD